MSKYSEKEMTVENLMEAYQRGLFGWYPFHSGTKILIISEHWQMPDDCFPSGCKIQNISAEEAERSGLDDFKEERFDYILIINAIENTIDPIGLLRQVNQLLSPKGVLLAACENRLGMKYLCGEKDPLTGKVFDGVDHYKDEALNGRCYSKEELTEVLTQAGLPAQKYYMLFPGIQYPEIVLAENYTSNEELAKRYIPLYQSPDSVIAREEELCADFVKNGTIRHFADAFIVECSKEGKPEQILQASISANRGIDHASITVLYDDHVEKKQLFHDGNGIRELAENLDYLRERRLTVVDGRLENRTYMMPLLSGPTGDVYLRELLVKDQEEFIREMDRFRDIILSSSEIVGEKHDLLSKGFCDLVPLNSIFSDGDFVIIDQEYTIENCPIDFVLFRFINVVYADDARLEAILPKTFFYSRYELQDRIDELMQTDAEFNNSIKNRASFEIFNDSHMRNDAVMLQNREMLNENGLYRQYMETCFDEIEDKKIYVCGSDTIAEEFVRRYKDKLNIFKVIDDDRSMWGKELDGFPVCPIDSMVGDQDAYKVIVCSRKYKTLLKQMLRMQVAYVGIFDPERKYVIAALEVSEVEKQYMENCFDGVENKKIYVCGSDEVAEEFVKRYKDKLNIFKVIDDDRSMWGKELDGYPVCPIDSMVGDQDAYKVIVCAEKYKPLLKRMQQMQVLYIGIFDPERTYEVPNVKERIGKEKYHIGYCAGVYDLFHIGHINIFKRAKEHCDYLIVGVVSDEAVRANKHCEPFIPFEERIEMVRSCKYVDEAVKIPLEAATVWDAYQQYHFDVQFSGSDYENDPGWLEARQYLRDHGSEMLFFPYTLSTSSTKIKSLIEKGLLE